MSDQDWSPFANEPPSRPRPSPGPAVGSGAGPGRASVPPPNGKSAYGQTPNGQTPSGQGPGLPVAGGPPPGSAEPVGQRPSPPPPGPEGAPSPARTLSPPASYTPPSSPSPSPPTGSARPPVGSEPDFDKTTALRPPGLARTHAPLVPEPDGTAILPVIPADETPAPPGADSATRKKRSVKRHRGEAGLRNTVRGLGEALVTLGAVVLLYAAYEVFGVSQQINNEQQTLSTDLDTIWAEEAEGEDASQAVPELGDAFARMWAPDIRAESWTLVEGTEPADIEYAPGRYLDGAYPGELGNFTLAGHNVPAIFQKIRDLEPGDKVVIETKDHFYVYEVQNSEVVNETQVDVTAPVPRQPGTEPGDEDYWLTLFTCHPLWDNYERYVVYSQLVDTIDRDPEGDLPEAAVDPEV